MNIIKPKRKMTNRWIYSDKIIFDGENITITLRELLVSVIIIAVMLFLGNLIGDNIQAKADSTMVKYSQSVQVSDTSTFKYILKTKPGGCFAYGKWQAVDPVTFNNMPYAAVSYDLEEYTRHIREVEHKDDKGNIYYTDEEYYTWDRVSGGENHCTKINFLGVDIAYKNIGKPASHYLDTVYVSTDRRKVYQGVPMTTQGTVWVDTTAAHMHYNFYDNSTIEETLKKLETQTKTGFIGFVIIWIALTVFVLFIFYLMPNKWLTDLSS